MKIAWNGGQTTKKNKIEKRKKQNLYIILSEFCTRKKNSNVDKKNMRGML